MFLPLPSSSPAPVQHPHIHGSIFLGKLWREVSSQGHYRPGAANGSFCEKLLGASLSLTGLLSPPPSLCVVSSSDSLPLNF